MSSSASMEWNDRPTPVPLEPCQIQVWRAELNQFQAHVGQYAELLSAVEKERAGRFLHASDRTHYILGRGILRKLLADLLKMRPAAVDVETHGMGKPFVRKLLDNKDVRFNVSHSGGLFVVAFSVAADVGIDVEKIREDIAPMELASRYFAPDEIAELSSIPEPDRLSGFFTCWTRKEAYVKAHGDGLHIPLDQFSVNVGADKPATLRSADGDRWSIRSFDPGKGYAGALVAEGPILNVSYYKYKC